MDIYRRSRKGQITILRLIVVVFSFVMIWPILAPFINSGGQDIAVQTSVVGFEAFILANLNLAIFFLVLLFIVAAGFFGGLLK